MSDRPAGESGRDRPADEAGRDRFTEDESAHDRFTDELRAASPRWEAATTHRFVEELGDGSIDDEVFRRYLLQDYTFVETLAGVVGHAVANAPSVAAKGRLAAFLETVVGPENDYFERSFEALGVPASTWRDPEPRSVTRSFDHLLVHGAEVGGYAETLAVLLPVEWIYLTWATAVEEPPETPYLGEWVAIHAADEFADFVGWLRSELDREAADLSDRRRERVERLFVDAVALEVAFFDAAYGETECTAGVEPEEVA